MSRQPAPESHYVSIVVPARNEARHIAHCLQSLVSQDWAGGYEILIVDGRSSDGTCEVVAEFQSPSARPVRLLDNPARTTPHAFNAGIAAARGDLIGIVGAHAELPTNWVSDLVAVLDSCSAEHVGGMLRTVPSKRTAYGKAVALSLSHPFGVGNGRFRTGALGVIEVDAAGFGLWRRAVFDRCGGFNENLLRSQDMDMNSRLRRSGGRIMLVPHVVTTYFCRSGWLETAKYNYRNGVWVSYPRLVHGVRFGWRHWIPGIFVTSIGVGLGLLIAGIPWFLAAVLGAYCIAAGLATLCTQHGGRSRALALLPVAFLSLHLSYGLGTLAGTVGGACQRLATAARQRSPARSTADSGSSEQMRGSGLRPGRGTPCRR